MKIELVKTTDIQNSKSDLFVTFAVVEKKGKEKKAVIHNSDAFNVVVKSIEDKAITGKANEAVLFREKSFKNFRHFGVVGLGSELCSETLRQAASSVHSLAKTSCAKTVFVDFSVLNLDKKEQATYLQALTEGLVLTDYNFDELKSKKENSKENKKTEVVFQISTKISTDPLLKQAIDAGTVLAETVNFSRRLGDMPGNLMTPSILADTTVSAAKNTGVKVTVWDKARIKKENMGGLLGVSNGSTQEPRFIIMEYNGGSKKQKPVVFVGKGLTFDSGGISIKPSAGMEEMKYDMCGGANVIGAILAIAKLKLKVNVVGLVPSTENMPGMSATKPGDVHTARNGKTFEVNNTDAEGRLILADALAYATELEPSAIVDAATLTGAMVVALGNIHTGYFTRNSDLSKKVEIAADHSGELVWRMPLVDHHVKDMQGTFADLSNMSSAKGAGSATAAAFLEQFVGDGIPWAHFDIAGTGWATGNRLPYCPKKGASGAIIRTFVEIAKQYE